jgi:arylsulfotransferase ASST
MQIEQNAIKRAGVGLRAYDPDRACPGFTLFAPHFAQNRTVYLIDLEGTVAHTWQMPYAPGLSGYLTERGTLFYNGRTEENSFLSRYPFKGGVALEADWQGNVLWEVRQPDHHHHGILLRNGNVLLHCLGRVPDDIARRVIGGAADHKLPSALYAPPQAEDDGAMYADYLAELTPKGETVWQWRSWEHLDPVEDGFAEVQAIRTLWALGNGMVELADGDLLVSYRPISTIIRIERGSGRITWKLGPPTLAGQHAPMPLDNGNILIFDNGVHRLDDPLPFSRVIEVNPATNEIAWTYQDRPVTNFFAPRMGNAQRLPNGNTFVNEATFGRFFEVTREGEVVWEYVNPYFGGHGASQTNEVFRALRVRAEDVARAQGHG